MFESLQEMIDCLKRNPDVIGIVRYGGREVEDMSTGGDMDLFVFVRQPQQVVEGLHFYVQHVPIDMSIRTLADLERDEPVSWIDERLLEGDIIYDITGQLEERIEAVRERWEIGPSEIDDSKRAYIRFSQKHALDKVRYRLQEQPIMCKLVLNRNVYWVLRNYFRVRGLQWIGEKRVLEWFSENDSHFHELICGYFETNDVEQKFEISVEMSGIALEPIGGMWRDDEILAFGRDDKEVDDLQKRGEAVYRWLFQEEI